MTITTCPMCEGTGLVPVATRASGDTVLGSCTSCSGTGENWTGTLDELEPGLRALGFTALQMMSGPIDLAEADPYGARRVGSVNIQTERWAHHVWRALYVEIDGRPYLTDAKMVTDPPLSEPFGFGLFPLIRG